MTTTEPPRTLPDPDDGGFDLADPSAAMVLHRVLAVAARTFLLNDLGDELVDDESRADTIDGLDHALTTRPLWAQSTPDALAGSERRATAVERIHQSRVGMRRIRSNLRTYRLLLDPSWGTSFRAELAWYGDRLGAVRDLQLLRDLVTTTGPEVMETAQVALLEGIVAERMEAALEDVSVERGMARRFHITQQMMALWEGPAFKAKASRPAADVLPAMLERAWRDVRGAARTARSKPTEANLHNLRIRMKDLRYGCETVALIEGGPARKTAKAAERLQGRLGDLHDADFSIAWLTSLSLHHPELSGPIDRLVVVQEQSAKAVRKGWKDDLREVERRWRRWHR